MIAKIQKNISKIYKEGEIKEIYENINLYIKDLDKYFINDVNEDNEIKTNIEENDKILC